MAKATATKIEKAPLKTFIVCVFDATLIQIIADYFIITSHEENGLTLDFFLINEYDNDSLVASFKHWGYVIPTPRVIAD